MIEIKYLYILCFGLLLVYGIHRLNIWAVPKLQAYHFKKRMELQELKKIYEEQQIEKELAKQKKKSKENK